MPGCRIHSPQEPTVIRPVRVGKCVWCMLPNRVHLAPLSTAASSVSLAALMSTTAISSLAAVRAAIKYSGLLNRRPDAGRPGNCRISCSVVVRWIKIVLLAAPRDLLRSSCFQSPPYHHRPADGLPVGGDQMNVVRLSFTSKGQLLCTGIPLTRFPLGRSISAMAFDPAPPQKPRSIM